MAEIMITLSFLRFVNIIHKNNPDLNRTWNYIKKNLRVNIIAGLTTSLCWNSEIAEKTNNMIMILNLKDASDEVYDDIPEQVMKVAAEMFFYLNSFPSSKIIFWTKFFLQFS